MRLNERLMLLILPLAILPPAFLATGIMYLYLHPDGMWVPDSGITKLMIGGFFCVVFAIAIYIIRNIAHSIAQPIQQATTVMRQLADGQRHLTVDSGDAYGEVQALMAGMEQLRADLIRYEQLIQQQSADAAMGQLAAHVAHDIRTPVTTLQMVLHRLEQTETQHGIDLRLTSARATTAKLAQLADDLCDVAKARQVEPFSTDLVQVIQQVFNEIAPHIAEQPIQLTYEGPPSLAASVDVPKINRVLTNLIQNAVYAVGARHDADVRLVRVVASHAIGTISLGVHDNGTGIAEEHVPRLFERFFSTKGNEGTGLGLAYCKEVIEAHHGTIAVASQPGQGTVFSITIPQVAA